MRIHKDLISFTKQYYGTFGHENVIFLIIVQLHMNGLINDKKLQSMFRGLNNNTLLRRINTYHCKINDRWYDHEGMFTVLTDVYEDLIEKYKLFPQDIPMEVVINYVQKMLNKPKNYCIDWIIRGYVVPLINMVEHDDYHMEYSYKHLLAFGDEILMGTNFVSYNNFSPSGYCCDDCDGCYSAYKRGQYEILYMRKFTRDIRKMFKNEFNKLRDKSYLRNPIPCNLLD